MPDASGRTFACPPPRCSLTGLPISQTASPGGSTAGALPWWQATRDRAVEFSTNCSGSEPHQPHG
eukprot:6309823-Alexandrium_andersonii.AAC.1